MPSKASRSIYPQQAKLLDKLLSGPIFQASELPAVPETARKALAPIVPGLFDQDEESEK